MHGFIRSRLRALVSIVARKMIASTMFPFEITKRQHFLFVAISILIDFCTLIPYRMSIYM